MLVCHRHKFIFIKTKKTAGTSVEVLLQPLCVPPGMKITEGTDEIVSEYGIVGARSRDAKERATYWNHLPAEQLRSLMGAAVFDEYLKVATVRNPFDRLVSAFHHLALTPDERATMSPREFIDRFRSWVQKKGGDLGSTASMLKVDGRLCLDYQIRYESLEADLGRLLARIGIARESLGLMPLLKTKHRPRSVPVQAYYDLSTEELVRRRCAEDFDLFGYSDRVSDVAVVTIPTPKSKDDDYARASREVPTGSDQASLATTGMSDDLVYSIFKEVAAVEGKRNSDGTWNGATAADVQRILSRAFAMVNRAATRSVTNREGKPD
ncbi:sulfotransferase family 2 domain-containing protein [Aquibium sp. ELW1220]|uniref:sulfotransferase family 2 domain-containing protein n=1 Tax=Aquibium sp. ELW1220 TaxID=2976766 RepID=UPI0025B16127|nr:sulfotransferase family 2 domain-containing protein [Aquibium sp. ELW1220]MDN2582627.1 sulfotransferase family protein [Aquibium sp. ELW1220]